MSIYDFRDRPAYERLKVERHYAENKHILKWWTPEHDKILARQIAQMQWIWYWNISDKIAAATAPARLETWKKNDPLCSQYAWYNVLMYFAAACAQQLDLTKAIRQPKWKTCPLCGQEFIESSLPLPLVERLGGMDKLDFCSPCLSSNLVDSSNGHASKVTVMKYLQDLTALIRRVPTQNFGEGVTDLHDMDFEERVALLRLRMTRPSTKRIKLVFGSWLNALIQAGVLEDSTRKTSRGIQSIAKDGHVCLSLGEKTIDDFLHSRGIRHEKEPKYPERNYRGDFAVNGVIIEYFGLAGNPDYDAKIKEKTRICRKYKIALIAIYPQDLISQKKLESKLSPAL
jgi:hypothetical protein